MEIYNHPNLIPFKAQYIDDKNIMGYDDEPSQNVRNAIREWHKIYSMPYQSIYEKEYRLTDYQLGKLLKPLINKSEAIDYSTIMSLPIYNVQPIDSKQSCFRGATLVNKPECLEIIKKCGIERVVDLIGYTKYKHSAISRDLEYYSPNFGKMTSVVWSEPAFQTQNEFIKNELQFLTFKERNDPKVIENIKKKYPEESKNSVAEFVEFIKVLQKGRYYIGCEFGTDRTRAYLLLNDVFNPKADIKTELKLKNYAAVFEMDNMYKLYKKLTPEHKKQLGWTKEFEKNVLERLTDR